MNIWVRWSRWDITRCSKASRKLMRMTMVSSSSTRFYQSSRVRRRGPWKWSPLKTYGGTVCIWRTRRKREIGLPNKGYEIRQTSPRSLRKQLMLMALRLRRTKIKRIWETQWRGRKWRRGRFRSYSSPKRLLIRKAKADQPRKMLRTHRIGDSRKIRSSRAVVAKTSLGFACWECKIARANSSQVLRLEE